MKNGVGRHSKCTLHSQNVSQCGLPEPTPPQPLFLALLLTPLTSGWGSAKHSKHFLLKHLGPRRHGFFSVFILLDLSSASDSATRLPISSSLQMSSNLQFACTSSCYLILSSKQPCKVARTMVSCPFYIWRNWDIKQICPHWHDIRCQSQD